MTGESKWITGEEARKDVHRFRHSHDAILVGVNTVIKDNPSLTTRLEAGGKNPVRVVLDNTLRTPLDSKIVNDRSAETMIVTGARAEPERIKQFTELGIEVIKLETEKIGIDDMLKKLGKRGYHFCLRRRRSEVQGSFLKEKAFQQIITYIAPKLLGGKDAPAAYGGEGIARLEDTVSLKIIDVKQIGQDIRIIAEPV